MHSATRKTVTNRGPLTGKTIRRYEFLELLGMGTLGQVYRAHDQRLQRDVAVKVSDPGLVPHGAVLDNFMREARIQASLEHANIVPIYDLFQHENSACIVMRLVEGVDLRTKMEQRANALEPVEAVTFMRQIFDPVGFAHRKGVIHQDLKPENVYVTWEGEALVLDFSAAQMTSAKEGGKSRSIGTPNYMSPEQVEGRYTDARTDIYSLGLMVYEMVTGHHPFESASNVDQMLRAHVEAPPLSPRHFNPSLPTGFGQAIMRAIAKAPRERFRWCHEFSHALESALGRQMPYAFRPADVRWDPRAPVSLPVRLHVSDHGRHDYAARTVDLAVGGAAIRLDHAIEPGIPVLVEIHVAGEEKPAPVSAEATVAWLQQETESASCVIGLNFTSMADGDRGIIAARVREALLLRGTGS